MQLKLVNKTRLVKYGKIVESIINGKRVKELYLPFGIHTTTNPIIDNSKNQEELQTI